MKNYLYLLEHDLKVNIINNRTAQFTRLKVFISFDLTVRQIINRRKLIQKRYNSI
jgi:hypothetical protein